MFEYKFTEQAKQQTTIDFTPKRNSVEDAGYDVRACLATDTVLLYPKQTLTIGTGICIHIANNNYVGFLIPRSSTGKRGIMLKNTIGVIDSGYTAEIGMMLTNTTEEDVLTITNGDRLAQLVFLPIATPTLKLVNNFSFVSVRGENGFGSSGR